MNGSEKPKALIAMSGGVDSSAAALLAVRMGYDCTGATMKLVSDAGGDKAARDAARIAGSIGIPHMVLDYTEGFISDVVEPFVCLYESGATPNPCIDCNERIKFGMLYDYALERGYDKLVTGHYARIVYDGGSFGLARAADAGKDQSYFLYNLTQEKLKHILFPLGNLSKSEVRNIAAGAGLENAEKKESQDICFVQNNGHAEFILNYRGRPSMPGNFTDASGFVIGRHEGIERYTIGQRKGLGVSLGKPMFVKEIRAETNEIVLALEEEIFTDQIEIGKINMIHPDTPARVQVMIRYRATPVWAEVKQLPGERLALKFDQQVRAPAKGQAAVLYCDDLLLGGGRIDRIY